MFPGVPKRLFRVHDWRRDVVTIGEVPAEFVTATTEGIYRKAWPTQLNRLGMGRRPRPDPFDRPGRPPRSHRHGQLQREPVRGNRRAGGDQREPLYRRRLWHGTDDGPGRHAFAAHLELRPGSLLPPSARRFYPYGDWPAQRWHAGRAGLFIGDDVECFQRAAALSVEVNFTVLERTARQGRCVPGPGGVSQHVAGQ